MTHTQHLRAANRCAEIVAARDWLAGIRAECANIRHAPAIDCTCGGPNQSPLCRAAVLRSHPAWRRYVRATTRLRLCDERTPKLVQRARFNAVLDLELAILRATHLPFGTIFDAAEEASDRVLHRARRWAA